MSGVRQCVSAGRVGCVCRARARSDKDVGLTGGRASHPYWVALSSLLASFFVASLVELSTTT